jgi:hypothetical protein
LFITRRVFTIALSLVGLAALSLSIKRIGATLSRPMNRPCEKKPNWLFAGDHFSVHLMPSRPDLEKVNPARHFTLEVARLS